MLPRRLAQSRREAALLLGLSAAPPRRLVQSREGALPLDSAAVRRLAQSRSGTALLHGSAAAPARVCSDASLAGATGALRPLAVAAGAAALGAASTGEPRALM